MSVKAASSSLVMVNQAALGRGVDIRLWLL